MRNVIFALLFAAFVCINPNIAFSFDMNGWWKLETQSPNTEDILLITDTHFCGLPYKVINKSNNGIEISIHNSKKATKITESNANAIIITTVNGKELKYSLISHDTNLTRQAAIALSKEKTNH
jgi:hypothetical protein